MKLGRLNLKLALGSQENQTLKSNLSSLFAEWFDREDFSHWYKQSASFVSGLTYSSAVQKTADWEFVIDLPF